jgi:RTX calcium-binding nonapeptide repeat (4 copies)
VLPARAWPSLLTVLLFALGLAAFLSLAGTTQRAQAAPCPGPVSSNSAGVITIQGDPSCSYLEEDFRVYCASTVKFDYVVAGVQSIPGNDTGVPCSATSSVHVVGNGGDDDIDLSAVTSGNGFTAITQNLVDGGFQNDTEVGSAFSDVMSGADGRDYIQGGPGSDAADGGPGEDVLQLRDGTADTGNCGYGFDGVQADAASLDGLFGCEIVDRSAEPAAAKKKCKKKHGKKHHCKKRRAAT